MKLCLLITIIACLTVAITAYEQYIGNARHPDHPGKCYHKATDYAMEIGEVYRPVQSDACAKYYCREDFVIRINSCPRYMVPGNCKAVEGDYSKPFPKCCASLHCIDQNGNEEIRETYTEI